MTEATLLALGSAALHAAWNLLIKASDERFLAAWGQFLFGGVSRHADALHAITLIPGDAGKVNRKPSPPRNESDPGIAGHGGRECQDGFRHE